MLDTLGIIVFTLPCFFVFFLKSNVALKHVRLFVIRWQFFSTPGMDVNLWDVNTLCVNHMVLYNQQKNELKSKSFTAR